MAGAERGQPGTWRFLAWWAPDGSMDLDRTLATLPASEDSAARLMAECYSGQLHYLPGGKGKWLIWDGRHHKPDDSNYIGRMVFGFGHLISEVMGHARQQIAAQIAAQMPGQLQAAIDQAIEAAWARWEQSPQRKYASGLRSSAGMGRLLTALIWHRGESADAFLDHHWRLLNVNNCVVNLAPQPGEPDWYSHDPGLMLTYCVGVNYNPEARCPQFENLVWRATGCDTEVYHHLLKVLGYALLGRNPHHLIYFLSGPTASGKSALLEIFSAVLGPRLAYDARPVLISSGRDRHSRDEASMAGMRLITIAETNERLFVDEMQLKRLTGQGQVSLSVLYEQTNTAALVTWLIIVANNQMPSVQHLDAALRRRSWVLPMGPTIPEEERNADKVREVVEAESEGILALLVSACRQVMADGGLDLLRPPAAVLAKTAEWESEQDTIATWAADKTIVANGVSPAVEGRHALADYLAWCKAQGPDVIPQGRNHFYDGLSRLPGVSRTGDSHHVWFRGFLLRDTPLD